VSSLVAASYSDAGDDTQDKSEEGLRFAVFVGNEIAEENERQARASSIKYWKEAGPSSLHEKDERRPEPRAQSIS
jgi:hypothetical protein